MAPATDFEIPIWLILFVLAGIALFVFKISTRAGDAENRLSSNSLRLFLLIATALLAVAGILDFVKWVGSGL